MNKKEIVEKFFWVVFWSVLITGIIAVFILTVGLSSFLQSLALLAGFLLIILALLRTSVIFNL